MTRWGRIKAWVVARWKWLAVAVAAIIKVLISRRDPGREPERKPDSDAALHTAEVVVRGGAGQVRDAEIAAGQKGAEATAAGKLDTAERELEAATPGASSSAEAANAYADTVRMRRLP